MKLSFKFIKNFVFILLLSLCTNLFSQELTITNRNESSLSLKLTINNYDIKETESDKEVFHEVVIKNIDVPKDKGKPELPYVNRFIAIPHGAKVKIVVNDFKKEVIKDINIIPSKGFISEYDSYENRCYKDASIYSKDEFYPKEIVSLTDKLMIRGIDAIGLMISPTQYNPISKELIVYSEINITIEFEGSEESYGDNRLRSPYFDPILQHHILNYCSLPIIDYSERMQSWIRDDAEGAEYVIIIPDDESFREHATNLANYRKKQGIITKIFSLGDINVSTKEELKAWFKEIFNTWSIPPVAICLMGDYSTDVNKGIPSFLYEPETDEVDDEYYSSDRPFSDIDDDFLPDMVLSRLCAANSEEARIMVKKLIEYEFTDPVMDEDFYNSPLIAYSFQTDKWFQICAESINGFLKSKGKIPIILNEIYDYGYDGVTWSIANNTEQVLNYFGPDGLGYLPSTPDEAGGVEEYQEMDAVINVLNQGTFIAVHRDHGWYDGWASPNLKRENLNLLNNGKKLPFLMSINCGSGAFMTANCFLEAIMRLEEHGAIGGIGTSWISDSFSNDSFTWGLWDFFENDFLPDYGTPIMNNNNYMPAFANVSAKYFLFQQNFPNTYQSTRETTSNIFHALCDAFLNLFSDVPQQMDVEHDETYNYDNQTLNIKAPQGSTICISAEGKDKVYIANVAEGTGEYQTINVSDIVTPNKTLIITVTKSNHLRYETTVPIITDKPFVRFEDFNFYENSDELIFNKNTSIDINLKNIGATNSSNITLSLSCDSDKIHITNNNNTINALAANESITVDNAFNISIDDGLINSTKLLFTLTIEHNGNTYKESFFVNTKAPIFKITEILSVDENGCIIKDIRPGKYFKIKAKVLNCIDVTTNPVNITLSCNDGVLDIIDDEVTFNQIEGNDTVTAEFNILATEAINEVVFSSLSVNVNSGIYTDSSDYSCFLHLIIDDFENNIINDSLWTYDGWKIDSALEEKYGKYCIKNSKNSATIETEYYVPFDGKICFNHKVRKSCRLLVYIDDKKVSGIVGENIWKEFKYDISQGLHKFKWEFQKFNGNDAVAYIDHIHLRECGSSIQESAINNKISIHPNPANTFINIDIDENYNGDFHVTIYNSLGVKVMEMSNRNTINIESLPSGMYFINVKTEHFNQTSKFSKN